MVFIVVVWVSLIGVGCWCVRVCNVVLFCVCRVCVRVSS